MYKYVVIELQTAKDGKVANIVTSHDTVDEAWSKYHQILASAATSAVPRHAAALLQSDGTLVESRFFEHMEA